jgi:hypothetical protein
VKRKRPSGEIRGALETCRTVDVERERVWKHLECDFASELRVARAPHIAHASRAKWGDDFIRAER